MTMGCAEQDESPVVPQRTEPSIRTSVTAVQSRDTFGKKVAITVVAYNHGETVTLPYKCSDHLGFEVRDKNNVVVLRSPVGCDASEHDLTIEHGTNIQRTFEYIVSLPIGSYSVRAGLVEHDHKYPWVHKVLEINF